MGGLFSSPEIVMPVQSNDGQMMLAEQQMRQNELLAEQQRSYAAAQTEADAAKAEQLRELEMRDAEAEQKRKEAEEIAKKGKRDLLYRGAVGVEDDTDSNMLLLGGG